MENAERVAEEPRSTSLFPLPFQPISDPNPSTNLTNNSVPQWLCNPSFTADLSVVNDAKSSQHSRILLESEEEDEEEEEGMEDANAQRRPESRPSPSYELLPESASDEERDRKKKRKRKRKKISSDEVSASVFDHDSSLRKPDVRYWVTPSDFKPAKDYYFDSRGDRNNLAFGCLYRMDVARYKLRNSTCSANLNHLALYRWNMRSSIFDGDMDAEALDSKVKANGRYWSAKYAALERHKNFKRMRIIGPPRRSPTFIDGDFIPLLDDKASGEVFDGGSISRTSVVEESWEDEMLRKTREFNKMTREHPHDEKIWLDFAKFQDRVASTQPQKGARLQTLEKKISILEKATELNPDNEELLLCLLNSYQSRDSTDVFIGRWEKILMQHSGSYKLWNEFLRVIQGEFSRFKVSEMRKMYANAIQALSSACSKQYRQVHQTANAPALDPATVQQELGLVDIFLSLCRFEWQAGYQELATALFQAEIEYSLFCPSLLLTEQSKRRLFEHFWNSNGARFGEDGALGWSSWLEKEEEQRQKIINEESNKNDGGGWTGWSLPLSKSEETSGSPENMVYNDVAAEEFAEESERDIEQKDDTEALLKMLGIDADAEADSEVKDPATWTRWAEVELSRDSDQWMPVHARSDGNSHGDGMENREGDEHLLRVVLFEDVSEYLFSISSEEARLSLISQFIDFFGGRISQRICTNSSTWAEKTHCLEVLPDSILDDLRRVHDVSMKADSNRNVCMESLLNSSTDISMRTDMMKFLRNAALLCITAFPRNYILEEAALVAEELLNTRMNSSSSSVTPCRALAKSLLKSNRQDVLLCGVYAQREAVFGNVDHARKIFDMALASIEGLPLDLRSNAFLLYFWYAEMERDNSSGSSSESLSRAIHILSCFGSGVKYSPFKCQPSSLQLLKAHQGFKEQIRMLRTKFARGIIDDISIALICSAALFEELTTGWIAGIEILDQALSFVLPERRNQSYELEFLSHYHVSMLWRHREELKLLKVWDSVIKGLQIYPFCPKFYSELVEISHLHTSPNKLRWIFDEYCHKKPSVIVWLFALSFEISRGGSQHRIRGLFERAFSDDRLRNSVVLWRCYIAYEINVACNPFAARRIMFRAVHACPWSKKLWLDGFVKLNSVLTAKELSDLQEVMRDKELNLRTDIYEILLQDEVGS